MQKKKIFDMQRFTVLMGICLLAFQASGIEFSDRISSGYYDGYAKSYAISGDLMAVGAPNLNMHNQQGSALYNVGRVYIYKKTANEEWEKVWELLPEVIEERTFFGDGLTLIDDHLLVWNGEDRKYIHFENDGTDTNWVVQEKLEFDGQMVRTFNQKVLFQDYDKFYLVELVDGTFKQTSTIELPDEVGGQTILRTGIGESVELTDDWFFVGMPLFGYDLKGENFISNSGAVLVFKNNGGTYDYFSTLTANSRTTNPRSDAGAEFGSSIAQQGTFLIIGAQDEKSDEGREAGAIYLFNLKGDNWVQSDMTLADDYYFLAHFGAAVAIENGNVLVSTSNDSPFGSDKIYHYYIKNNELVFKELAGGFVHHFTKTNNGMLAVQVGGTESTGGIYFVSYDAQTVGAVERIVHTNKYNVYYDSGSNAMNISANLEHSQRETVAIYRLNGQLLARNTMYLQQEPSVLRLDQKIGQQMVIIRIGDWTEKLLMQ